ncbi:hypothetical protein [Arcanobacterium pinnipediorum]
MYAKGVSISDCARLSGVAYETARRFVERLTCMVSTMHERPRHFVPGQ